MFTAAAVEALLPGRVRVTPFPLAVAPPLPAARDRRDLGWPADAVVVLVSANLASSFERKNPLGAIAAFRAAFGDRTDRLLVLKIGNPDHFPADFARIVAEVGDAANIRVDTRPYPMADVHALTAAADIVLSLHRSEGFGLVLAEAMLLGRPVIATGWSGNMDFMDARSAALVGYRLVASDDPRQVYRGSHWAEPDLAQAARHLRDLADDAPARARLGARGREHALAHLGAGPLAAAVRGLGLDVPGLDAVASRRSGASAPP
jgi:glycosyltransferase involved in cell wall biosynthesis